MNEREALIQAILDNPKEDLPRLVFADWQEEHGNTLHAELIRVQCELSSRKKGKDPKRKKELQKREKELLKNEVLSVGNYWAEGLFTYHRGFIDEYPIDVQTHLHRYYFGLPSDLQMDKILDRILGLDLWFRENDFREFRQATWFQHISESKFLSRVTSIQFQKSIIDGKSLRAIASMLKKSRVEKILLSSRWIVLETLSEFVLCPHFRPLVSLTTQGEFTQENGGNAIRGQGDARVAECFRTILFSERMQNLRELTIFVQGFDTRTAELLLQSPYLSNCHKVTLWYAHRIRKEVLKELQKKFGNGLDLKDQEESEFNEWRFGR